MTKIIAVINQKGGVGKTTTSINLSYFLSEANKSVLLIDLDPQGNTTMGMGIEPGSFEYSINDVLLIEFDIKKTIINKYNKLDVVPANIDLDNCEQLLSTQLFRESRLSNAINNLDYDYIIIDCRPSLGILSINALFSCNFVIVPCEVSKYSLDGLAGLLNTIKKIKIKNYKDFYRNIKILLTKYDSQTSVTNSWFFNEILNHNELLFKTIIRRNEAINQAHIASQPVSLFNKTSTGAADYLALSHEILSYE